MSQVFPVCTGGKVPVYMKLLMVFITLGCISPLSLTSAESGKIQEKIKHIYSIFFLFIQNLFFYLNLIQLKHVITIKYGSIQNQNLL